MTDDAGLADEIRSIRVHGKGKDKYDNVRIGLNARLHTLQAAIFLAKLDEFPQEIIKRQEIAARYTSVLSEKNEIQIPIIPDGLQSAWAQYSILCPNRDKFQGQLRLKGIPSAVYYPKPLHLQLAYSILEYTTGNFRICEEVAKFILSFPMHPYLKLQDVDRAVS